MKTRSFLGHLPAHSANHILDGHSSAQLHLDFRTGRPTAIDAGSPSSAQRAACTALNRERTRSILEAAQFSPPGEQIPADVWDATFTRKSREWELPLISLEKLGIFHDKDGLRSSNKDLIALPSGAEACPYHDPEWDVVYKLFDLRVNGSLGKKISLELNTEGEFELVEGQDADLKSTLVKLQVLNEAGAHPTEIVGLSDDGNYLIAKQPWALPMRDYLEDRNAAIQSIHGIVPNATGLRRVVTVIWSNKQPWLVADLHERNIMRNRENEPTIIDALIGPATPMAVRHLTWLRHAVADAESWRETGIFPIRRGIEEGVIDDEL